MDFVDNDYFNWPHKYIDIYKVTCSLFRHSLQSNYLYVQKIETSMRDQIFEIMILVLQPYPFFEDAHVQLPVEDGSIGYIDIKLNFILMIISMSQFLLMVRYWFWHNRKLLLKNSGIFCWHQELKVFQTLLQSNLQNLFLRKLLWTHHAMLV